MSDEILVIFADANRGLSFAGKNFSVPPGVISETEQIKKQCSDKKVVEYKDFKGNWTKVKHIVIFTNNRVYPADRFFKFPANYRYLITNAFNFAADDEVYTAEVFRRE